jgi:hypothetical protein
MQFITMDAMYIKRKLVSIKFHCMFHSQINKFQESTKEIKRVRAILEYFHCMIGNTAEALSCCSSRTDSDMLQVWFNCSPFVLSEHCTKMTTPLQVCTKDKQSEIVCFFGM